MFKYPIVHKKQLSKECQILAEMALAQRCKDIVRLWNVTTLWRCQTLLPRCENVIATSLITLTKLLNWCRQNFLFRCTGNNDTTIRPTLWQRCDKVLSMLRRCFDRALNAPMWKIWLGFLGVGEEGEKQGEESDFIFLMLCWQIILELASYAKINSFCNLFLVFYFSILRNNLFVVYTHLYIRYSRKTKPKKPLLKIFRLLPLLVIIPNNFMGMEW